MSLIWHIARKDLRRLRLPLIGWVVLIAAKLGLGVLLVWGTGADSSLARFTTLAFASRGMAVLEVLFGYVLVASVVHADLMVGTTAFWMTRPISGARMFGGKAAALVAIFGIIPVMITLPWWLACGYGLRELAFATGETLIGQGLVVLIALPLATLTDGLARFLLWTVVMVGALIGLAAQMPSNLAEVSALLISATVFVVSCAAAAVIHFCTRRFYVSVGILTTGGLAALCAAVWPWQFTLPSASGKDDRPSGQFASGIKLSFQDAQVVGRRTGPNIDLAVGLQADGVPRELILSGSSKNLWTWESGLSLKRPGDLGKFDQGASWLALGLAPFQGTPSGMASRDGFRAFRGLAPWSEAEAKKVYAGISVPAAFAGRVQQESPSYLLRADLRLTRPVVVGEKPARDGEKIVSEADCTRIVAVRIFYRHQANKAVFWSPQPPLDPVTRLPSPTEHRIRITLAEHGPFFFGRSWFSETEGKFSSAWPRREYFLVNRQHGNAASDSGGGEWKTNPVWIGTVAIVWRTMQFSPVRDFRPSDNAWEEQPGWVENLSLAKLKFRTEEQFTQEVRVERFTLKPGGAR